MSVLRWMEVVESAAVFPTPTAAEVEGTATLAVGPAKQLPIVRIRSRSHASRVASTCDCAAMRPLRPCDIDFPKWSASLARAPSSCCTRTQSRAAASRWLPTCALSSATAASASSIPLRRASVAF